MTPYAASRALVDRVEEALAAWVHDALASAGCEAPVRTEFAADDAAGPLALMVPHRMALWPKLVENVEEVPLLGAGALKAAARAGVPGRWLHMAAAVTEGLASMVPAGDRKRPGMPSALPLAELPAPLAKWYRAAGEPWLQGQRALMPAWSWKPGIKIRLHYLVQVIPGPGDGSGAGLLASVVLATHRERQLEVALPGSGLPDEAAGWVRALAESVGGEASQTMLAAAEGLTSPDLQPVPLMPEEMPDHDDFAGLMRGLGHKLRPSLLLMLQLPLGGDPLFTPAVSPSISADRMPRETS